jgi:hypothetical protein
MNWPHALFLLLRLLLKVNERHQQVRELGLLDVSGLFTYLLGPARHLRPAKQATLGEAVQERSESDVAYGHTLTYTHLQLDTPWCTASITASLP